MPYYDLKYKNQPAGFNMGQMHSHEFFELEFVLSGARRYFSKSQMVTMKAPSLVVIAPGTAHKFESDGCEVYTLQISPKRLSEDQLNFLNLFSKKGVARFPVQSLAAIRFSYDTLFKIYSAFPFDKKKKMLFNVHLGNLFFLLYTNAKVAKNFPQYELKEDLNPTINPVILKVLSYIDEHYKENFSLGDLCETFNVSKSYLSSSFAKATGSTIFQYKLSKQLGEAKKLCLETRYSYDKIAELTGFSSGNYFRLIFKKHEGQTPNRIRHSSAKPRKKK